MLHLVNRTVQDGMHKEDVRSDAVVGILDRGIATSVAWASVAAFDPIGSDAIALLKGHRDVVAVISAKTRTGDVQVRAVVPDRTKARGVAWRESIPVAMRETITTVGTDRWEPYIRAVAQGLPAATVVLDRFHGARPLARQRRHLAQAGAAATEEGTAQRTARRPQAHALAIS